MNSLNTISCSVLKPLAPVRRVARSIYGLLIGIFVLLVPIVPGHAAQLEVPSQYKDIATAIAHANNNDIIDVAPGDYTLANNPGDFNIETGSLNLTIESDDGASNGASVTTLDLTGSSEANPAYAITYQNSSITSSSVFKGFTIENGHNNGAVAVIDCSPKIENCIFSKNAGGTAGGGIYTNDDNGSTMTVTISNCKFLNNTAGDQSSNPGFGGAIECEEENDSGSDTVNITDCIFVDNTATYDGGAIDTNSNFSGNPTVTVENCSFFGNNALGFIAPGNPANLPAPGPGQEPGTVDVYNGPMALKNCILYGDTSPVEISTLDPGATATHSDVKGSSTFPGTANINSDPKYFATGSQELDLKAGSPCYQTGTNSVLTVAPTVPKDYNTLPWGSNVSMGALSPMQLVFGSIPSTATPGTSFPFTVTMETLDTTATATTYVGTLHFTSTDGAASLPVNSTLTSGTATFSATLNTAGSQTITATDIVEPPYTGTSGTITVAAPTPPTATNITDGVDFNTATAVTLKGSDTTAGTLSFAVATDPGHGTITGTAPNLTYTPNTDFQGTDTFTFTVTNTLTGQTSSLGTVQLNVAPGTPTATAQTGISVVFNTAKSITLTGNDPDSPALSLTYSVATGPNHGSLSGTAPNLTYTPTTNYHGPDSFTFTVSNGTNPSTPATISLTVAAPGTPTATPQPVNVLFNTATGITLAGTDPDSPPLSLTFAVVTGPNHGSLSGTAPNLTYTPTTNYHGPDSFTFTASNVVNTSSAATVTLTVSPGTPTANGQTGLSVAFNTPKSITLTGSDPDVPVLSLTYAVFSGPAHGGLTGTAPNLTYTPTSGYSGPDSFVFTISNGTNVSTGATVSLNVAAAPVATHFVITAPSSASAGASFSNVNVTAEDASNNVVTGYSGMVHFTSTDTGTGVTLPANATLTNGAGTFSATLVSLGNQTITATDTVTSTITGKSNFITVGPGAATYLVIPGGPEPFNTAFGFNVYAYDQFGNLATGYNGTVAFTSSDPGFVNLGPITLDNGVGGTSGVLKTAGPDTITATDTSNSSIMGTGSFIIQPGPTARFAVSAPANATPGTPITFTVTAYDTYTNQTLDYSGTVHFTSSDTGVGVQLPADTTLTIGSGSFSATLVTPGSQTITATDTVTSSITGTSGSITVSSPVGTPIVPNQFVNVPFNTPTLVTLTGSDPDLPPLPLNYTIVTQPTNGILTGTAPNLTYTPNNGSSGTDSFTFNANNGTVTSNVATVTLTVAADVVTHFVVVAPGSATSGTAFNFTVTAEDGSNSVVPGYTGTVNFTSTDTAVGVSLPANTTLVNGVGTLSATLVTPGNQTITAADTTTPSLSGTSGTINVTQVAVDVSGIVTVVEGGYRFSPFTHIYTQSVTITNNSGSAITGPISLVVTGLTANVSVSDATGTTVLFTPAGRSYVNGTGLAAGANEVLTLQFYNPNSVAISYSTQVLAGPGSR